jgi:ketosteroid isomerase-like protein
MEPFYAHLEAENLESWADLWIDDCVYLNPFASAPFPNERTAGRDAVVELIAEMRERFDVLAFHGLTPEPTHSRRTDRTALYVAGDCQYKTPSQLQTHRSHFLHRLEIVDGRFSSWIDYTNPLMRTASVFPASTYSGDGANGMEDSMQPLLAASENSPLSAV